MSAILGENHPLPTLTPEEWLGGGNKRFLKLIGAIGSYSSVTVDNLRLRREVEAWYGWYKARIRHKAAQLVVGNSAHSTPIATLPEFFRSNKFATEERARVLAASNDWLEVRDSVLVSVPEGRAATTACLVYDTRHNLPEYSYIMDVVLGKLSRDAALVALWSTEFMSHSPHAIKCDTIALVFEGSVDAKLVERAAARTPKKLVLLALRLKPQDTVARVLGEVSILSQVTGIIADAPSLALLRHMLGKGSRQEGAGYLRMTTTASGATVPPHVPMMVLLPWGPRSGFGNRVSLAQATRPAATRTHRCLRLKDAEDSMWPLPTGSDLVGHLAELCPVVDVRYLKRRSASGKKQVSALIAQEAPAICRRLDGVITY